MRLDEEVSIRGKVAAVGFGEVPTGTYPDRSALSAGLAAARDAVRMSGIPKDQIDVLMPTGSIYSRDFNSDLIFSRLVEELGMNGTANQNIQVMSGGASGSVLFKVAGAMVASGLARNVLVVHADKLGTGLPIAQAIDLFATLGIPEEWERPYGQHFSAIAALTTQRYRYETGTTAEQVASVCVALRRWAELNPHAMYRDSVTVEEILASKMLSEPLHAKESNVLADGASAFIVTSAERAKDLVEVPVYLLGAGSRVTHYSLSQEGDLTRFGMAAAARDAFSMAEVQASEIDLAEIYDSYAVYCLIALEEMGFVSRGDAGKFVEEGNTLPGGSLPMTTNGGMLSQGHTGAGGGVALVVESIRQLMGLAGKRQVAGAKLAVETGMGGSYMDSHVLILGTEVR